MFLIFGKFLNRTNPLVKRALNIKVANSLTSSSSSASALSDKQRIGIHKVELLGNVSEGEKLGLYQRAFMLVTPSLREDFPLVNLEALSCGTPVVASDVGGIGELVKNDLNGLLVPSNDPKKLADALRILLNNKELRQKYGKNGRQIVEEFFSWDSIAKQLINIYETIC